MDKRGEEDVRKGDKGGQERGIGCKERGQGWTREGKRM